MSEYIIKLFNLGILAGEGFGFGDSAMEAFDRGVEQGTVTIPHGQDIDVEVLSTNGIIYKFSVFGLK